MDRGLFDFDRISPDIDRPSFISVGGGYPNERARSNTTVDIIGAGSMSLNALREFQETARSGYPMIGGRRSKKSKRPRRTGRNKKQRNHTAKNR
jgi:hypothetical protein